VLNGERGALVVTGGGRGIGARIATRAARSGWPVALIYRSRRDAAALVVKAIEDGGGRGIAIEADVGNEADVIRAFEAIDRQFGQVRGLVNNAAVPGGRARLEELRADQLDQVFRTNVFGAFFCSREAVKRMSTRRGGRGGVIVSISSGAVNTGSPGVWVHYAATKGALETMSRGLARELAADGVRVNVVRPGVIDTDAHRGHGDDRVKELMARVPLGRMGDPDEVAAAVLWLLSEEATYVTGAVLDVTGGL
jgi:NAD(P)-dependent dehydrogenase (short-subunit alcohol dehydrogenase family)